MSSGFESNDPMEKSFYVPCSTSPPDHQTPALQGCLLCWVCPPVLVQLQFFFSSQLAAMTQFAYCGCTGQDLFPVLLRGLAVAAMGFLVAWARTQPCWLQFPFCNSCRHTKDKACSFQNQLSGLATGIVSGPVCVVISPLFPRAEAISEWLQSLLWHSEGCGKAKAAEKLDREACKAGYIVLAI